VIVPFTDKIDFAYPYIVLLDFLFNIFSEGGDFEADIFTLLFFKNFSGDGVCAGDIEEIEKGEEKGVTDEGSVETVAPPFVPVSVREEDLLAVETALKRLFADGIDMDVGKEFAEVEVMVAFDIVNLQFTGEAVELADGLSVMRMRVRDLPDKQVEHISHQEELRCLKLSFIQHA
jgi:hypothetical protein